jgi:hypothetical protein
MYISTIRNNNVTLYLVRFDANRTRCFNAFAAHLMTSPISPARERRDVRLSGCFSFLFFFIQLYYATRAARKKKLKHIIHSE